ncbi:response regulator transcription factor [Mucilaginibacter sp. 44-25]|uniref:response regulator transcription factor n=1 Tax=Mucilaginibacter sp. 44-25 TaxID=1895794 RepID=UPI0009643AD0|nr:response regulator transcription factor [Mucilaginibacter sp. 44-25]OJW17002.1 MAG: DNA-binding response regulator [Mucilaginibacter sp. 44-25]HEK21851.1 response regulator transcription factor [Bacteroidota bacterium]
MKILVIEDEPGLRDGIQQYFAGGGNVCEVVADYASALQKINIYRYDCIVLDITLPDGSGLDILENLKINNYPDGVLIVSAKNSLDDRLNGLDMGADDYLVKPFHLSELKARVMSIVRRKSFDGSRTVAFNEIKIDLTSQQVIVHDSTLKLTKKEYALLLYFIANKAKVISKNAIAEHLWGDAVDLCDNFDFLYSHIKNLRKKIMDAGGKDYIQSAYGMGYKFTEL